MFKDQSFAPTEFESTIATEKLKATNSTQTENIGYREEAVQKTMNRNIQVQTATAVQQTSSEVDYNKLAAFLKRVTPGVLQALDEIYDSSPIDELERVSMKDSIPQIRFLTAVSTLEEINSQRKISSICWSINGGLLAVSYSDLHHETWCDHLSEVRLYEFSRQDKFHETTNKIYETNSCVTCLAYHPTEPSMLSAGLFNGDVILWNFIDETSVTPMTICTHGDAVSSLLWISRTINDSFLLVTSSSDGYIFVHEISGNSTNVNRYRKFKIIKEHNPAENSRPRSAGGRRERAIEAGLSITCLDFSSKNPDIFIIGTLCGGLYKCSMDSSIPIQGDDTTVDPVIGEFDRSEGTVTCIKCSLINNIFIMSNTNKEIRVFDISENNLLRVLNVEYTVTGLKWLLNNQDIILAHGADSVVKFYDITNGIPNPDSKIETTRVNTACLDYNRKRDIIAIADTQGNLELWKIPKLNNSIFASQLN